MQFKERVTDIVTGFRNRRDWTINGVELTEEIAVERFNQIVELGILPLFKKAAELLEDTCVVQLRHQEHTTGGPFVESAAMVVTPKEGAPMRRFRQPYQKLDLCLRQRTLKVVIFTELQHPPKLQIEEIDLADLDAAKLEQCVRDFIVDIFR
jgi:hypothetical protein